MLLREVAEKQSAELREGSNAEDVYSSASQVVITNDGERALIRYLKRVGAASPRHIQSCLDLPKTTAFRKLALLVKANLIARTGRTTAIRYRFVLARAKDALVVA
jgi:hypothetical protein